ncbi:MAG TPA: UPF0158 family protein [Methanospirillum sp.]|nr:UPF0158 family protein [Methanospirillum sp.]
MSINYGENEGLRVVTLSLDDIAQALENCTHDTRYVIDMQEQEIVMLSEHLLSDEEIDQFFEEMDSDTTGRYIQFPVRIDSRIGYADMENFIEEIEDTQIQCMVEDVIRGSKAFRRFKDLIAEYPDLEKRWYAWKDDRARDRAVEWLTDERLIIL